MLRLPTIQGIIDRRILANYRIDAECMARVLPPPFRPLTVGGYAIGGVCLIRLINVRPECLPVPWGLRSENAAHRIAVMWDDTEGQTHQGVYIPRRDTDSWLNSLAGGRIFPGTHHRANFDVSELGEQYSVTMISNDGRANVRVAGSVTANVPAASVFGSLDSASQFFESGSLGYSDAFGAGDYHGLELECDDWDVQALKVTEIESSFFDDRTKFPSGTVEFDCGLLMRGITHRWLGRANLCCNSASYSGVNP